MSLDAPLLLTECYHELEEKDDDERPVARDTVLIARVL